MLSRSAVVKSRISEAFWDARGEAARRDADDLRSKAKGDFKGLILDLRNNPGGLLDQAVRVSDRFLPGGKVIVSTVGRGGKPLDEEKSHDRDTEAGYPMVVVVNKGSASASEIVAGALQDHGRAVVLGAETFGKGSVQTVIELEDGSGLKLTIARYLTPRGRSIQDKGITPDVAVAEPANGRPPEEKNDAADPRDVQTSVASSAQVEDPQLKAALAWLKAGKTLKPPPAPKGAAAK